MKFSIIIPVYQAEKYLEKCVNSVLSQTFTDFQLILVDDGSSDSSPEMCDRFKADDSRVTVIHQKNSGVSSARNKALEQVNSEYVIFIDSDDWIDENWLERINGLADEKADMIAFDYYEYHSEDFRKRYFDFSGCTRFTKESGNYRSSVKFIQNSILCPEKARMYDSSYSMGVPWGKAYRTEIIRKNRLLFDTDLVLNEDVIFNIEFMCRCRCIVYVPEAYYHYRIFNESSMRKNDADSERALKSRFKVIDRMEKMEIDYKDLTGELICRETDLLVQCMGYCFSGDNNGRAVKKKLRHILLSKHSSLRVKLRILKRIIMWK